MTDEQYYALCVEEVDGSTEIALFELDREALPGAPGISCAKGLGRGTMPPCRERTSTASANWWLLSSGSPTGAFGR